MNIDFLKQLETESFSDLVARRPGIPCDHPGCASHLSHPCEGCGRYGAGLQNGPDVFHAKRYIEKLAMNDAVIHSFLMLRQQNNWTWEQTLMALGIKQSEINKKLTNALVEIQQQSIKFGAKVEDWDKEISDRPK